MSEERSAFDGYVIGYKKLIAKLAIELGVSIYEAAERLARVDANLKNGIYWISPSSFARELGVSRWRGYALLEDCPGVIFDEEPTPFAWFGCD